MALKQDGVHLSFVLNMVGILGLLNWSSTGGGGGKLNFIQSSSPSPPPPRARELAPLTPTLPLRYVTLR